MHRDYRETSFGQIQIHIWGCAQEAEHILVCLPPSPYSGKAYDTIAPELVTDKLCVLAVDYPRFSGEKSSSINDYAGVVHDVLKSLKNTAPISLVGFHTGCLVAVETSLAADINIARLILIDVPYFSSVSRAEHAAQSYGSFPVSLNLSDLQSAWDMSVTRQKDKVPLARAFDMFVDHISAGVSAGEPFAAAFDFDCQQQFSKVSVPSFVIATHAGLYSESLCAAERIENSILIEEPSITASVLEQSASITAKQICRCLSN